MTDWVYVFESEDGGMAFYSNARKLKGKALRFLSDANTIESEDDVSDDLIHKIRPLTFNRGERDHHYIEHNGRRVWLMKDKIL